jgi:polysaccharide export outer membrane protein
MQAFCNHQMLSKSSRLTQLILAGAILLPSTIAQTSSAAASTKSPVPTGHLAVASPTSAPQSVPASSEEDGYVLGPGDRIRIDFFNVPEFTGEFQVLPNGTVNLPQVGAVAVQGRNLKQASETISARYSAILTRPIVTLSLLVARPITIVLAGEINRPGSYTIPAAPGAGDSGIVPNLTRTLQLAEGVTQAADLRRVQIRRQRPASLGGDEVITVNLWQLIQTGDARQDLRLRDGDSIFIPANTEVSLQEARQLSSTNLAVRNNRPLKIAVVGEVNRPGPYTLLEGSRAENTQQATSAVGSQTPSVTQAIQVAGGITQSADIRNIRIRRLTRTGPEQIVKVDFWKLIASGDILQDLPIQDGDTIEIPTATSVNEQELTKQAIASISPGRIVVNVVGEVERPGALEITPNAPLNQALLAAGGFNRRARKSTVTLIRLNPNGTVIKRDISIDLAQGLNEQGNPSLRNNDIIVVRKNTLAGISDALGAVTAPLSGFFGIFRLLGLPLP